MDESVAVAAGAVLNATFLTPAELARQGLRRHAVARLVAAGRLIRLANGRLVGTDCPAQLVAAGRHRARLDCVSLLALLGVFTGDRRGPMHVQIEAGSSRLPPRDRSVVAHWRRSESDRNSLAAPLIDALAQACRCQSPPIAIATLDSAWHQGFVNEEGIAAVFQRLPRRFGALRPFLERRAESGSESIVRVMLRVLGAQVEVQVVIPGVGRVDHVVDGWLIVECDSRAHHSDWEQRVRDLRRDVAAAALGYTTIRLIAEDIFRAPDAVKDDLRRVLLHRRVDRTPSNRSARPRSSAEAEQPTANRRSSAATPTRAATAQAEKPSPISSMSSSRSSTERKAPAAAFSWNASRSSRR